MIDVDMLLYQSALSRLNSAQVEYPSASAVLFYAAETALDLADVALVSTCRIDRDMGAVTLSWERGGHIVSAHFDGTRAPHIVNMRHVVVERDNSDSWRWNYRVKPVSYSETVNYQRLRHELYTLPVE